MKEKQSMIRNSVRILTVLCALCLFAGVTFAQTDQSEKKGTSDSSKKGKKSDTSSDSSSKKSSSKKIDINSASKEDLAALPVIGDATAQKIIDGRPYKSKHDLVTKNILSQDQYDKVKDQLVAHGGKSGGTKKSSSKKAPETTGETPKK
jgi:competence protein ComEA